MNALDFDSEPTLNQHGTVIERDTAVMALVQPLLALLGTEGLTELAINRPQQVFVETNTGWVKHDVPDLTLEKLQSLATAIATYSNQTISEQNPILSATLPNGERVQIVQAPAVPPGTISFTLRCPSAVIRSMDDYVNDGFFDGFLSENAATKTRDDDVLMAYYQKARTDADAMGLFFMEAVKQHRNIAVVGDTGSGKTAFMKMLCSLIPQRERIITIEDVREILNDFLNCVNLLYSKGGQGTAKVTPAGLIASTMRMKPDRVLLAELRGSEAYDFLKLLTTGHSGSITSYHAASVEEAIARFVLMAKEHSEAAAYQDTALKRLFFTAIDIVAHVKAVPVFNDAGVQIGKKRIMSDIYFNPQQKMDIAHEI